MCEQSTYATTESKRGTVYLLVITERTERSLLFSWPLQAIINLIRPSD